MVQEALVQPKQQLLGGKKAKKLKGKENIQTAQKKKTRKVCNDKERSEEKVTQTPQFVNEMNSPPHRQVQTTPVVYSMSGKLASHQRSSQGTYVPTLQMTKGPLNEKAMNLGNYYDYSNQDHKQLIDEMVREEDAQH